VGALDSGHGVYVFRYEPSDIDIVFDIELGQEIELAAHRVDLRCDLAIGDFVGHGIGLAEFALEFHEKTLHRRCSPVLALFWCPGPFVLLAATNDLAAHWGVALSNHALTKIARANWRRITLSLKKRLEISAVADKVTVNGGPGSLSHFEKADWIETRSGCSGT
jgi:hypothetical protein